MGLWFRDRPAQAGAWAAVAFAALGVWGFVEPGAREAVATGAALPTALAAVTFGRRGGAIAGVAGVILCAVWAVHGGRTLDAATWLGAAARLALGLLLGDAIDGLAVSEARSRAAESAAATALETATRHRAATEINDRIVQEVAVAKWALESGNVERAVTILDETVGAGQRVVSELLAEPTRRPADDAGKASPCPSVLAALGQVSIAAPLAGLEEATG